MFELEDELGRVFPCGQFLPHCFGIFIFFPISFQGGVKPVGQLPGWVGAGCQDILATGSQTVGQLWLPHCTVTAGIFVLSFLNQKNLFMVDQNR